MNEEWEEYAAAYLEKHPEISAAVPQWADEVEFHVIDDELDGATVFHFTRTVGLVKLWGAGTLRADGALEVDLAPDLLINGEIGAESVEDAVNTALQLSVNLQNVISILTTQSRPLRRAAEVDERLREME